MGNYISILLVLIASSNLYGQSESGIQQKKAEVLDSLRALQIDSIFIYTMEGGQFGVFYEIKTEITLSHGTNPEPDSTECSSTDKHFILWTDAGVSQAIAFDECYMNHFDLHDFDTIHKLWMRKRELINSIKHDYKTRKVVIDSKTYDYSLSVDTNDSSSTFILSGHGGSNQIEIHNGDQVYQSGKISSYMLENVYIRDIEAIKALRELDTALWNSCKPLALDISKGKPWKNGRNWR